MSMFLAIKQDVENWCESMETPLDFDEETQEAVLEKVHHHWEGHGNVAGLKADHYFLASILDPYTSPHVLIFLMIG